MKVEINNHTYGLELTEEQCFAFFKLQTVQDLLVYLQSICNVTEKIKTLSIDEQEIELSDEGLQLPLKQVQALLPLFTLQELQRLPVELISQIASHTDAKTVHALLNLPSRLKPPAMDNHFGSELAKQILTTHFQVDESLWKAFEQFTQKEQAAGKVSTFATWFQNGDLKSFLALINIKNQTPPRMNYGFFLRWVTIFGPSVMAAYQEVAAATIEQKILYALVAPTNLVDPRMLTEILTAENSAIVNYSSLLESLRLSQKIMQVKTNAAELDQIKEILRDRQFSYLNFVSVDFQDVDLSDANLRGANFSNAKLNQTDLYGADLSGVVLYNADLSNANLYGAVLHEANLYGANLQEANLRGTDLLGANLRGANLRNADLQYADLCRTDLRSTNLSCVNLSNTNLSYANLYSANLYSANLQEANLCDAELSNANLSGVNLNDANLSYAKLYSANLQEANLCDANLNDADLSDTNLSSANLNGVNLSDAKLSGANLNGVNLSNANLSDAHLYGANLHEANLYNAILRNAFFGDAILTHVDLRGADFSSANLSDADLSGITWGDQLENFPNFQNINLAGARMDFSVFSKLTISENEKTTLIHGIQVKTLAFLTLQITEAQTLEAVDEIMQSNRNGILYLAQKRPSVATIGRGTFFPSHAEKLSTSASQFEAAIAARKTELQAELQSQASSSAAPKF